MGGMGGVNSRERSLPHRMRSRPEGGGVSEWSRQVNVWKWDPFQELS